MRNDSTVKMDLISAGRCFTSLPEKLMLEEGEVKPRPVQGSEIVNFFKGKTVFVTGATGFLGKLLIEKLLRTCDDIETIYILIRPKKDRDETARIQKLFEEPIFSPLRKYRPDFPKKISILRGDCFLPDLGLGPTDRQTIIDQVNVIFHVAATVRFDVDLKTATNINVRSTRDLLLMAKNCKNLASFVHVSTAFAHCNRNHIDEIFYKPAITAQKLIELTEQASDLTKITAKLIKGWPNTYVFTKSVAEYVIKEYGKGLPVCLFRPSIVIATYKEPLRSWIDNLNGATGIVVGSGMGVLHTIHCDPDKTAETVPADYVINAMIAASHRAAVEKLTIYNYVSAVQNRATWRNFMNQCSCHSYDTPFEQSVWYYSLKLTKSLVLHYFFLVTLHFLPAIPMDLLLLVTGQKPKMLKIYWKIYKLESVISHFCTKEWTFSDDNMRRLWRKTSEIDKIIFPFSMAEIDWNDYHITHILGLRTYVMKQDLATLPEARVKFNRLSIWHNALKILWYLLVARIFYFILSFLFKNIFFCG